MSKHTKGWRWNDDRTALFDEKTEFVIYGDMDGSLCTENEANKDLIAAAPEMYEALKLMKEYIHGHVRGGVMLNTLEAALAKAEAV